MRFKYCVIVNELEVYKFYRLKDAKRLAKEWALRFDEWTLKHDKCEVCTYTKTRGVGQHIATF